VNPPTTAIIPISSRHGREAAQATVKLKPTTVLLLLLCRLHLHWLRCLCWLLRLLLCHVRLYNELLLQVHLHLHPLALLSLERDSPLLLHRVILLLLLLLHTWRFRLQQQL
jgi:hypothetical protein